MITCEPFYLLFSCCRVGLGEGMAASQGQPTTVHYLYAGHINESYIIFVLVLLYIFLNSIKLFLRLIIIFCMKYNRKMQNI